MTEHTQNRNGKMLLANWFEISEKEYLVYWFKGYEIEADEEGVIWWLNGKRHRTDGPAYIGTDGIQEWYIHGKLHRTDGAAVIRSDCSQEWWLNDRELTESDWHTACSDLLQNPDITHAVSE